VAAVHRAVISASGAQSGADVARRQCPGAQLLAAHIVLCRIVGKFKIFEDVMQRCFLCGKVELLKFSFAGASSHE
jgi:hypothetical protein